MTPGETWVFIIMTYKEIVEGNIAGTHNIPTMGEWSVGPRAKVGAKGTYYHKVWPNGYGFKVLTKGEMTLYTPHGSLYGTWPFSRFGDNGYIVERPRKIGVFKCQE